MRPVRRRRRITRNPAHIAAARTRGTPPAIRSQHPAGRNRQFAIRYSPFAVCSRWVLARRSQFAVRSSQFAVRSSQSVDRRQSLIAPRVSCSTRSVEQSRWIDGFSGSQTRSARRTDSRRNPRPRAAAARGLAGASRGASLIVRSSRGIGRRPKRPLSPGPHAARGESGAAPAMGGERASLRPSRPKGRRRAAPASPRAVAARLHATTRAPGATPAVRPLRRAASHCARGRPGAPAWRGPARPRPAACPPAPDARTGSPAAADSPAR